MRANCHIAGVMMVVCLLAILVAPARAEDNQGDKLKVCLWTKDGGAEARQYVQLATDVVLKKLGELPDTEVVQGRKDCAVIIMVDARAGGETAGLVDYISFDLQLIDGRSGGAGGGANIFTDTFDPNASLQMEGFLKRVMDYFVFCIHPPRRQDIKVNVKVDIGGSQKKWQEAVVERLKGKVSLVANAKEAGFIVELSRVGAGPLVLKLFEQNQKIPKREESSSFKDGDESGINRFLAEHLADFVKVMDKAVPPPAEEPEGAEEIPALVGLAGQTQTAADSSETIRTEGGALADAGEEKGVSAEASETADDTLSGSVGKSIYLRVAGFSLLGLGAAGTVVGAIFGVKAQKAAEDASSTPVQLEWRDRQDDAENRASMANIFFILGGTALAGGTTGLVLDYFGILEGSEEAALLPRDDGAMLSFAAQW